MAATADADDIADARWKHKRLSVKQVFNEEKRSFANELKAMRTPTNPMEAVKYWLEMINQISMHAVSTHDSLGYAWEGPQQSLTEGVYGQEMKKFSAVSKGLASPEETSDAGQNWMYIIQQAVDHFATTLDVIYNARHEGPKLVQNALKQHKKGYPKKKIVKKPQKYGLSGNVLMTPESPEFLDLLSLIPAKYDEAVRSAVLRAYKKGTFHTNPAPIAAGPEPDS